MPDERLTGSLEDNILTMLVWDTQFASEIVLRVPVKLFSTRYYQWIAEQAISYLERFQKPAGTHIADLLEERIRRDEDGKLILRAIEEMERLAPLLQPAYVLTQLDHFIEARKLTQAIERAAAELNRDDLEKAKEALFALTPTLASNGSTGIWLHKPEEALGFLNTKEEDFFSSAVDALDDRRIRPARKTMTLMIAPKKRGKSWWLVNVGKANMMQFRKRVLHITLEMPEDQVAPRYLQSIFALTEDEAASLKVPRFMRDDIGRFSGIEYQEILAQSLRQETRRKLEEKIETLLLRPPLYIKEFPTGTLTIAQYNAFLDSLARRHNFTPDLVLIDYPDLMSINSESLRVDTGRIFRDLRGIAMARNHALCVVTQTNRMGEDAKLVVGKHVGEDYSKLATADTVLTFTRTAMEKERGLARILVEASRTRADGYIVLLSQSYATGQFALDSIPMFNQKVRDELARVTGTEKQES
jgi:replicative DNA helicase